MNLFNDHLNLSNNIYDNAKILKSVQINKQQELVNRNPTAKYYQTIALNLHEQVQYLKRRLNEENSRVPTVVQFGTVDNMSAEDLMAFGDPARYVNPNHTDWESKDPRFHSVGGIMWTRIRDGIIRYIRNNPREVIGELLSMYGGPIGIAIGIILNSPELIQLYKDLYGVEEKALHMIFWRIHFGRASAQEIQTWETARYMLIAYYNGGYVPVPPGSINQEPNTTGSSPTESPMPDWANQAGNQ